MTTAHIPIIVAGCLFGPVESTITGLILGLGSLFKASAFYVMPNDGIFFPKIGYTYKSADIITLML